MEVEKSFHAGEIEARGALCVECLSDVLRPDAVSDRCGATLCRACAAEFYVACAGCDGLVPRDEAQERADDDGMRCAECFRKAAGAPGAEAIGDEEVETLVAEYVSLHAEKKKLDARMDAIKEALKGAAEARPRVAGAVVLRAGEDAGVRCSYALKTTYDAKKLLTAEQLLGPEEFASLFERKVTFSPNKESVEEFLAATDEAREAAREAVRAAAEQAEVATLNVITQKKKKAPREERED
ncbi:MAG TPA: hypothetical protein VM934_15275 [Pyrinomonadaceae bacterium]|nr:hypothetical protein [Pyrinomonadaceae bacterium]